ncbi:iron chelate uptake ABC transporter family permease subunit [Marinomonas sp.]|nr:iron chelate uptake ABC transporter family permease subunit [Marinomonas sp.]MDB4836953.1 iron chelate uptake ABC transporter family permease subunit [Marinomonas sp.]
MILCLLILTSLFIGTYHVTLTNLLTNENAAMVLLKSRIPRTLAIVIAGGVLGLIGGLSQVVLCNRFAEPTTIGTAQGVAIGLLVTHIFWPELPLLFTMLIASGFGLLSLMVFFSLIRQLKLNDPMLLPLIGLIYSAILGAFATFIAFEFDLIQFLMVWLNGDFSTVIEGRYELIWGAAIIAVVVYWLANQLNLLNLGELLGRSLGVPFKTLVFLSMVMIALSTSMIVATVGMISFLGLVVPNIVRHYLGDNLKQSLPWSALIGASLLLTCDIVGRYLAKPFEIPASLVFGVLGGGFFVWTLYRGKT